MQTPMIRPLRLLLACAALGLLSGAASAAVSPVTRLKSALGEGSAELAVRKQAVLAASSGKLTTIGVEASGLVGAGLWVGIGSRTVRGTTTYGLYVSPRLRLGLGLGAKLAVERSEYATVGTQPESLGSPIPVGELRMGGGLALGVGVSRSLSDSLSTSVARSLLSRARRSPVLAAWLRPFAARLALRADNKLVGDATAIGVGVEASFMTSELVGNFGVPIYRTRSAALREVEAAERMLLRADR